jgi:beta-N-acetylhexosaminidase
MKPPPQTATSEILLLRLAGPQWSISLERQLREAAPGGVLLPAPLPNSPEILCELLLRIAQTLPTPPILAIEEEGGAEGPLSALLPPLPSPQALGQMGRRAARQSGELIGEALRLLGFNTNLAPTLDVAPEFTQGTPGARTFGTDPRGVAECALSFLEGLSRHKILACGKHFPGLSGAPPVAGREMAASGRSMAEIWRQDLVPYRELLPRLPSIMMSTTAYKAYDFDYPRAAVLSSNVVGRLLRAKLGYGGLVIAPQIECERVRGTLDAGRAAVQSLSAGCDMLLVENVESWQSIRQGIEQALESGQLPRERLEQTQARIRAAKKGLVQPKGRLSNRDWDRLARRFLEFSSNCEESRHG